MKVIPYSKQFIDKADIKAVTKTLNSDYLTTGPVIKKFEEKLSKYCNSKYAICLNSATSGLFLACKSLGLKKNDIVWSTPITFVSSLNCALHCGCIIDLVDINFDNFNICEKKLEKKLLIAKKNKKLPKVVIAVHLGGVSCNMKKIYMLSRKYKFKIIEDASHALGSEYGKKKVGNCQYSDVAIFSFHPVKTITTGEGGAVTTNNKNIYNKIKMLREHGIERDIKKHKSQNQGQWYYEQHDLGYNFRMSDINAALGISQLSKINTILKKRNTIQKFIVNKLRKLPIIFQEHTSYSSCHLTIAIVSEKIHKNLFNFLRKKKIFVNLHYIPIYMHPFFKFNIKDCKKQYLNSEKYYKSAISLPNHYNLTVKDLNFFVNQVKIFFKKNNLKIE
jgi:UDP-4-amino-4,6-dideoxy-N-acetyl-beta-L-altrosamine transaminase